MRKDDQGRIISVGDTVTIEALGLTVTGKVIGEPWWGPGDGWYLELEDANVPGGYSYYKQGQDGGDVVKIEKPKVRPPWEGEKVVTHDDVEQVMLAVAKLKDQADALRDIKHEEFNRVMAMDEDECPPEQFELVEAQLDQLQAVVDGLDEVEDMLRSYE